MVDLSLGLKATLPKIRVWLLFIITLTYFSFAAFSLYPNLETLLALPRVYTKGYGEACTKV